MNIDEMPAGREMDALVAEKVFGVPHEDCFDVYGGKRCVKDDEYGGPQCYSTDIAAAWEVVEKIREDYEPRIELWDEGWEVTILTGTDRGSASGRALTAPLAICRAALKAV